MGIVWRCMASWYGYMVVLVRHACALLSPILCEDCGDGLIILLDCLPMHGYRLRHGGIVARLNGLFYLYPLIYQIFPNDYILSILTAIFFKILDFIEVYPFSITLFPRIWPKVGKQI